jgi:hypothetical protein
MSDPSLDPHTRSGRFGTRLRRRLGLGLLQASPAAWRSAHSRAGCFGSGTRGFWITTFSVTLFLTLVTLLIVGYGSLESPDPGTEPTQDDRPVADREALTGLEHPTDEAGGPD